MSIYHDSIETAIIANLIFHDEYRDKALPYIHEDYFEAKPLKTVFKLVKKYLDDYDRPPTTDILINDFNNHQDGMSMSHEEMTQTREVIQALSEQDNKWFATRSEKWCQERAYHTDKNWLSFGN